MRLEMLRLYPESFGETVEEYETRSDDQHLSRFIDGAIFGAFEKDELIGVAGFYISKAPKMQHRGNLYSVYVKQAYWGKGLADKLLKAVIDHAVACGVMQIHCTVVTSKSKAIKLYERHGFVTYGTEPRSLKTDGKYFDAHLMVKKIK